jgi:hypothetical protein
VSFSFFLCLAAFRTRSSACDTRFRPCVRCVLCSLAFLLVPALGSAGSAASAFVADTLFVGFPATIAECDFSRSFIVGYGSSPSRRGPEQDAKPSLLTNREISRFPRKERPHMPRSPTTPGRLGTRAGAPIRIAFHRQ